MKEVTCNKCGWVHMGIGILAADAMNLDCSKCVNCGNHYTNFRFAKDSDAPDGVTIQPIRYTGGYDE